MSDESHALEGTVVTCEMSDAELAELSPPRETEGEVPVATKQFAKVSLEDAAAACADAAGQADDRDSGEGE